MFRLEQGVAQGCSLSLFSYLLKEGLTWGTA